MSLTDRLEKHPYIRLCVVSLRLISSVLLFGIDPNFSWLHAIDLFARIYVAVGLHMCVAWRLSLISNASFISQQKLLLKKKKLYTSVSNFDG